VSGGGAPASERAIETAVHTTCAPQGCAHASRAQSNVRLPSATRQGPAAAVSLLSPLATLTWAAGARSAFGALVSGDLAISYSSAIWRISLITGSHLTQNTGATSVFLARFGGLPCQPFGGDGGGRTLSIGSGLSALGRLLGLAGILVRHPGHLYVADDPSQPHRRRGARTHRRAPPQSTHPPPRPCRRARTHRRAPAAENAPAPAPPPRSACPLPCSCRGACAHCSAPFSLTAPRSL